MKTDNKDNKHPTITRRATIITICFSTQILHTDNENL